MSGGLPRRRLLGLAGAGVALAGAGAAVGAVTAAPRRPEVENTSSVAGAVPFHGEHQAGITTAAQDRMHFVAFDVKTTKREELVALLKEWTDAAVRMTNGQEAADGGAVGGSAEAPPKDTGEALDLPPSALWPPRRDRPPRRRTPRGPCRSTASTRPGSPRPRRTGCTSWRST